MLYRVRGLGVLLVAMLVSAWAQAGQQAVELGGQRFTVEVAQTDASRSYGLMFREQMDTKHGMLFIFPDSAPRAFWMKNTRIALDILYFDAERRLVSAQLATPPCTRDPCPSYPSRGAAKYVLELNAGVARGLNLKPGDVLTIEE